VISARLTFENLFFFIRLASVYAALVVIHPKSAFEHTPGTLLLNAAPLFEKEGHSGSGALFLNRCYPRWVHRAGPVTAFPANDHPNEFHLSGFSQDLPEGVRSTGTGPKPQVASVHSIELATAIYPLQFRYELKIFSTMVAPVCFADAKSR
jgi:hypothetical protein